MRCRTREGDARSSVRSFPNRAGSQAGLLRPFLFYHWSELAVKSTIFVLCKKHKLPFKTVERKFQSRYEAIDWLLQNQLGRRNLADLQRADLRGLRYKNEKLVHGGDRRSGKDMSSAHSEHLKTAGRIAEESGVSQATVERDAKFAKALDVLEGIGIARHELTSGRRRVRRTHVLKLAALGEKTPEKARKAWEKPKSASGSTAIRHRAGREHFRKIS